MCIRDRLIEMLPMSEELREQVTPDMKIPVIRAMKPKKEKKVAPEEKDTGGSSCGYAV